MRKSFGVNMSGFGAPVFTAMATPDPANVTSDAAHVQQFRLLLNRKLCIAGQNEFGGNGEYLVRRVSLI